MGLTDNDGYRYFSVDELKALPLGTVFEHQTLGKCIVVRGDGVRRMRFRGRYTSDAMFSDGGYPWNIPMRILSGE